jgi:hypothetical protein
MTTSSESGEGWRGVGLGVGMVSGVLRKVGVGGELWCGGKRGGGMLDLLPPPLPFKCFSSIVVQSRDGMSQVIVLLKHNGLFDRPIVHCIT